MSFSEGRRSSLLGPLVGKTATFLVEGRQENVMFAQTLAGAIAKAGLSCIIFDLDALYSSNADLIFSGLAGAAASFTLEIPAPGSNIEDEFSSLFGCQQKVIVIDSLNTLYHLVSMEDGRSRGRKLMFALASLSQFAKANDGAVVLSMYRREGFAKSGKGRSISNLSDVTASVDVEGDELQIRTERGLAWPDGGLSSRIP
ncbi:MAG: hypothetical protein JRN24_01770 [Nitrososphaerota archaeon]|nr:hypothetical protein [Nitrososphaerota archaeon]